MIIKRTVYRASGVANDLLDGSLLLQVLQGLPGKRAIDLQTVNEGGNGDELSIRVKKSLLVELVHPRIF